MTFTKDFSVNAGIGATGGIVSRTATAPMERLRVMLQVQSPGTSTLQTLRNSLRKDGFWGLWRGNGINSLRVAPNQCLRHGSHHQFQSFFSQQSSNTFGVRMLSGALAGLVATVGTYPADLIRSLLSAKGYQQLPNAREAVTTIYKQQGLRGFYRGCWMSCLGVMPYFALNVTSAQYLKERNWVEHRQLNNLLTGGLAGWIAVSLTYPTDVIKRRIMMQSLSQRPQGILGTVKTMARNDGARSFYRGLGMALIRIFPSNAIQWAVISELKRLFK